MGKSILEGIEALLKAGAKAAKEAAEKSAEAARVARGEKHFPVEAFRGEGKPLEGSEFIVGHPDRKDTGWLGEGIYATNAPSVANFYASAKQLPSGEGQNVMPLRLNLKNPKIIDLFEKERMRFKPQEERNAWLQQHLDDGHDGVLVRYAHKIDNSPNSPFVEEYMVPNANQIRSRHAQFDESKLDSSDLLAGIGAGALALPALNAPAEDGMADGGLKKRSIEAIIRAYHGSPHRFDRFDMSKIGTGGGNSYGRGLYFAEDPYLAELWAKRLSGGGGHVYTVDLHVPQNRLIDYDAKFEDQPDFFRRWISQKKPNLSQPEYQMRDAIHRAAPEELKRLGVDVMRHVDSGTRNYVVFDDSLIDIIDRKADGGPVEGYADGAHMSDAEMDRMRARALAGRRGPPDLLGATRVDPTLMGGLRRLGADLPAMARDVPGATEMIGSGLARFGGALYDELGDWAADYGQRMYDDPLTTLSGSVRDISETLLPTTTLNRLADVATGVEGAEMPGLMELGEDALTLTGYKAGRAALGALARSRALPAAIGAGVVAAPSEAEAGPKLKTMARIADEARAAAKPMSRVRIAKDLPELTGLAADYPAVIPPVPAIDKKTGREYLAKTLSDEALVFKEKRDAIRSSMEGGYDPYFDPSARFDVNPKNYSALDDSATLLMKKPETRAKWDADVGNPEARGRLSEAYERGLLQRQGSGDWYFVGQLENEFIKEYGPDTGRKLFKERFPDAMAATTGGADPTANLLMAHYGNFIRNKGAMVPTNGFDIPYPVGGRYVGGNMEQFNKMIASPTATGVTLANPKRYNFSGNFIGNPKNPTIDEQMTSIIAGPGKKLDAPNVSNYGHYERPVSELAADYGVTPRYFQEVAWAGGKDAITKGGYKARPMMSHVNDAIQRTALLTGMTPKEVVRRALVRAEMPLYADGGSAQASEPSTLERIDALLGAA